jgi:hypothetical protein
LQRFEVHTPETEDFLHLASRVELDLSTLTSTTNAPSIRTTISGPKGEFTVTS